jgi:hypothetical protein
LSLLLPLTSRFPSRISLSAANPHRPKVSPPAADG